MTASLHLYALRNACLQAACRELVAVIHGRPQCTRRATWVVEFDRQMDLARRASAVVRN